MPGSNNATDPPAEDGKETAAIFIAGGTPACLEAPAALRRLRAEGVATALVLTGGARSFLGPGTPVALTGREEPATPDEFFARCPGAKRVALIWAPFAAADLEETRTRAWFEALRAAAVPAIVVPAEPRDAAALPAGCLSLTRICSGTPEANPDRIRLPVERLVETALAALTEADLAACRLLITAGPTAEPLDPVRFLTNRSSGRMGVALARAASRRGARVTLIHGPLRIALPDSPAVRAIPVRTAREMRDAVMARIHGMSAAIFCAAVADFAPASKQEEKIKKAGRDRLMLELVRTPDILAEAGVLTPPRPVLVGFAAESGDVDRYAREKLKRKNCDLLCANDIGAPGSGFEVDTNIVSLYRRNAAPVHLPRLTKLDTAHRILDVLKELIGKDGKP